MSRENPTKEERDAIQAIHEALETAWDEALDKLLEEE